MEATGELDRLLRRLIAKQEGVPEEEITCEWIHQQREKRKVMSERKKPPKDSYSEEDYLRQIPEDFDPAEATKPLSIWYRNRILRILRFLFHP